MFGYITINKDELKIKDYNRYRAFYCGVCHSLHRLYGISGQMTLSYDMTFLAILLSSLYEDDSQPVKRRCMPHPVKAHNAISNEYTDYAASMNVLLTFYKMKDDWEDERSVKGAAFMNILRHAAGKAGKLYPAQKAAIAQYIEEQKALEQSNEPDVEKAANPTGRMLAEIFCFRQDEWRQYMQIMGYNIGKFIYITDAFDDIDKDIKKHNYNPFSQRSEELNEKVKGMLTLLAADFSRAFERLPIIENSDILRNILYSGVWNGYNAIVDRSNR